MHTKPIPFPNRLTDIYQHMHVCSVDDGARELAEPLPGMPDLPPAPSRWATCWACGYQRAPHVSHGPTYCTRCTSAGADSPWINCTSCGVARKRNRPNEQVWTCAACRR